MNLAIQINQYNKDYIFFSEPIKNNIMNDGNFVKILYSNDCMILNGIFLLTTFYNIQSEKYYSKYKYIYNISQNKDLIEQLKIIEEEILKKYKLDKAPTYKIYEQISLGYIKTFKDIENKTTHSFILKISGIWETNETYGLTYKFI